MEGAQTSYLPGVLIVNIAENTLDHMVLPGFNVNESYNSYDSKSAGQEFRKFSEFISISIYRDYSGKNSGKPLITSLQCPHSDI